MVQLDEVQYEFEKALLTIDRVRSQTIFESIVNKINNKQYVIMDIEQIVVTSLKHIEDGWEEGVISLAQVYMSAKICLELISSLISTYGFKLVYYRCGIKMDKLINNLIKKFY